MTPADPRTEQIERRLAEVETRLTAVAGDRSLCDLSRTGPPLDVKAMEGAMSALLEARRRIRGSADAPSVVVRSVLDEWHRELVLDASRGPVWQAYRSGGIADLEAVLPALA